MLWRVGDGYKIHIWNDNQLSTPTTFRVRSPIKILDSNTLVENLIDHDTNTWNRQLINQIFIVEEDTTICNLPMSLFGVKNKATWWLAKNTTFSIKSAYALEVERERKNLGKTSNSKSKKVFWKTIWKLNIPSSVTVESMS